MRFRHVFMILGTLAVLAALYFTDPDQGMSTGFMLLAMATGVVAVAFAHVARKAAHDYPEADMKTLFRMAGKEPTGAGLALIALSIVFYGLLGLFGRSAHAADVSTYVPAAAAQYLPTVKAELRSAWPDHPMPEAIPALIEHESCISLTHQRCWSPTSRLKTAREEGAGLPQITRAYSADGSLRFDALSELKARHPGQLRELSWVNVYQRADLQILAVILMSRDNFSALRTVSDPVQRLAMADAAYNGGLGGLQRERRACAVTAGCDPQAWFGNVERTCLKSKAPLYGKRSACDINRHHVHDVILTRSPKYRPLMAV